MAGPVSGTSATPPSSGTKAAQAQQQSQAPTESKANSNAAGADIDFDQRGTSRAIWKYGVGTGLAAVLGAGGAIAATAGKNKMLGLGLAGAGAAAAVTGWLVGSLEKDKTVPIVASGITSEQDATKKATESKSDTGVIKASDGTYEVVDFSSQGTNFDNANLSSMRVGDGSIKFSDLVTRDGDLLTPKGAGYSDQGAALGTTDTSQIDPTDSSAMAALSGLQIGTDSNHKAVTLGTQLQIGTNGIETTAEAAAQDAYKVAPDQQHAIIQVKGGFAAFTLNGPTAAENAEPRGDRIKLSDLAVTNDKFAYKSSAPRSVYDFSSRVVPFATDDPIGYRAHVPTNWDYRTGVIRQSVGSYDSQSDAVDGMLGKSYIDSLSDDYTPQGWSFTPDEYFVIQGSDPAKPGEDYHVYAADDSWTGGQKGDWIDQYGKVVAATYKQDEYQWSAWGPESGWSSWQDNGDGTESRYTTHTRDEDVRTDVILAQNGTSRTVGYGAWKYYTDDTETDESQTQNIPGYNDGNSGNPPDGGGIGDSGNPPDSGGYDSGDSGNPPDDGSNYGSSGNQPDDGSGVANQPH